MQSHPSCDCQTIPIVDPGRYLESQVNCSSDSRRSTNSMAWVKMCLATEINRSKESADFSNVIPVVAVVDMVSVLVGMIYSLALLLYSNTTWPRCREFLPSERWTHPLAGYTRAG